MNKKRPVNLDLTTIKLPITGVVSILHRISGVFLLLLMPFMMYYLALSLKNVDTFSELQRLLSGLQHQLIVWLFFSSLGYHMIAGIRHLIMDAGYGEALAVARFSSLVVLVIGILQSILVGIWLW